MEYLFILGRNIPLSLKEIEFYLENNYQNFKIKEKIKNAILIEIDKPLKEDTIKRLGGTIFIGEILFKGKINEIIKETEKISLYSGKENKLNYGLFNFDCQFYEEFSSYLKKRFKSEGLKASKKKLAKILVLQNEGLSSLPSSKNQENYFLFKDNFGRIIQNCDYDEIEKRDMKKPVRRSELSISPRLAKIMINLSKVKENQILLDAFCGVGTILQEALLQNIKVIGIDIDKEAIISARKNLIYFNFKKEDYFLINKDSSKVRIKEADVLVSEPYLGELQKRIPSIEESKKIMNGFENLMIKVLKNLRNQVKERFVFSSPLIVYKNKKIFPNYKKIEEKTNLSLLEGFPIEEFREDSFIGRNIVIFEKNKKE